MAIMKKINLKPPWPALLRKALEYRSLWINMDNLPNKVMRKAILVPALLRAAFDFAFRLNVVNLDFVVTPRCTLCCRDCANLMQYYGEWTDDDVKTLLADAKRLTDTFDAIGRINLIGGEPLLYQELDVLCRYFCESKKVSKVYVISNGTIVPGEKLLQALSHKKVTVMLSGYKIVEAKAARVMQVLQDRGIRCKRDPIDSWRDLGGVEYRNRTFKESCGVFTYCSGMCNTLFNGQLHLCPRSAHGANLGFVKERPDDYVDIRAIGREQARKDIRRLFYRTRTIEACQHCDNDSRLHSQIEVAVQMKRPKG